MKVSIILSAAFLSLMVGAWTRTADSSASASARTPVLVELFTSEGCSSCPPADAFLQKLDRQPVPGEEMVVLSEHVDYWNHIGWNDPYSARFYSDRQSLYAKRLRLETPYTPQMVVDGTSEFVGSDQSLADQAFAKALSRPKLAVRFTDVGVSANAIKAHIEAGALLASFGLREAEVYVAIALNRAESHVSRGENAGRTLAHTAVVKSIVPVGTLRQGQTFAHDVQLKLDSVTDANNLRLVAFVQEPGQGRVIGAAVQTVGSSIAKAN